MSNRLFNNNETGLSHPFRNTAIRLLDDGRIAIMAGDNAGIILDEDTGEVTIFGKSINIASADFKIDGNSVDKELISDKRLKEFNRQESTKSITNKLLEIIEKDSE